MWETKLKKAYEQGTSLHMIIESFYGKIEIEFDKNNKH